jgi:pyruvate/2-oxoglutarate dehydrogenase complex dihydrolipoamide dehydrogenase (E3) component
VDVRVGRRAGEVRPADGDGHELVLSSRVGSETVAFDRILVAVGRSPRTSGLGLDAVGLQVGARGAVGVDRRLRTSASGVFASGDVTGLLPFTHVAAHHARVATPNALFQARSKAHDVLPWVTFTDPELARVGLTEAQARECWGDRAVVAEFDYGGLDRAITAGEAYRFAKLVGDPCRRLVGATVAAPRGGDAIAEPVAWVSRRAKIDAVSQAVHALPHARGATGARPTRSSPPATRLPGYAR